MGMLRHQLAVVFVGRGHQHLKPFRFGFASQRANHIIGLKTRHFKHGNTHRLQNGFYDRYSLANILWRLLALRFVSLKSFMSKRAAVGVESHTYMRGIHLFLKVFKRDAETVHSRHVFALRIDARRTNKRVVCTENHRVSVYEQKFFHWRLSIFRCKDTFFFSIEQKKRQSF